jgi:hypothetical protein
LVVVFGVVTGLGGVVFEANFCRLVGFGNGALADALLADWWYPAVLAVSERKRSLLA